jgi:flagellar FliL protein
MAENKPGADVPSSKSGAGSLKLILVCVIAASIAGGGMFWFSSRHATAGAAPAQPQTTPRAVKSVLHLENFLVNLTDQDANSFFRVGIDLGLSKDLPKEEAEQNKFMPMIRDTILGVLGSYNSSALLAPDGKEQLKKQLLQTLQKRFPELGIEDIYFTDYLIQR